MAGPYLPVIAVNRSQSVRIGNAQLGVAGNKVPQELGYDVKASGVTSAPYYVDISVAENRRDLQRHSAIGSYIIVGQLTNSNSDWVVSSGGVVSAGTGLTVDVSAGELLKRSSGTYVAGASATDDALTDSTSAGQSMYYLVSWHEADGSVVLTAGTPATTGSQTVPATPAGNVALATVLFAHSAVAPGTITDVRPRP